MKIDQSKLLYNLLSTLVNEWGFEEVHKKLEMIEGKAFDNSRKSLGNTGGVSSYSKPIKKLTPVGQVDRVQTEQRKKQILYRIAEGFESREFLPSLSDVKLFLGRLEGFPIDVKSRSDSFRHIISLIKDMPEEKLKIILEDMPLYGPSHLAPLSDAIREANKSIRYESEKQDLNNNKSSDEKEDK